MVRFFTLVANIYTERAVNNEVVFLSSNQPFKRLRGDLYTLEQLGFLREGRSGDMGLLSAAAAVLLYMFAAPRLHSSPRSLSAQFSPGWNDLS